VENKENFIAPFFTLALEIILIVDEKILNIIFHAKYTSNIFSLLFDLA
jgi:hypothetical protein